MILLIYFVIFSPRSLRSAILDLRTLLRISPWSALLSSSSVYLMKIPKSLMHSLNNLFLDFEFPLKSSGKYSSNQGAFFITGSKRSETKFSFPLTVRFADSSLIITSLASLTAWEVNYHHIDLVIIVILNAIVTAFPDECNNMAGNFSDRKSCKVLESQTRGSTLTTITQPL